jgi:hypothetical protein
VKQQLFAGIDWATKTHAVCVVDQDGGIRARFEVTNTGKTFAGLIRRLGKLAVAGVAIERPDGPLVQAMLDAGLRVVVITPRQVKALRSRYGAAGAKSDPGDAYVLADTLRTDGHRLAALTPDSDQTRVLQALSRTRKDLVKARVALCNQLSAQLERCFPGAVGLVARLDSKVAIAFLRRYPTSAAAGLDAATLAAFLRRIGYCGRRPVADLLGRLTAAPPPGSAPSSKPAGRSVWPACWTPSRSWLAGKLNSRPRSSSGWNSTPTARSSSICPRPATASGPLGCWPRSVTPAPASPTRKPWPPSVASPPSPEPRARPARWASVGLRQAAARRPDRLRRRLPPPQPLGRAGLHPRNRPRQTTPPRRAHPRPRLDPRHLALLARPHRLQPPPPRRRHTTQHGLRLT